MTAVYIGISAYTVMANAMLVWSIYPRNTVERDREQAHQIGDLPVKGSHSNTLVQAASINEISPARFVPGQSLAMWRHSFMCGPRPISLRVRAAYLAMIHI